MSFVKKTQLYSHLMKILMIAINVIMFIITNVGTKEISVPSVKELQNGLKLKNTLLKYNYNLLKIKIIMFLNLSLNFMKMYNILHLQILR